ncbi:MAG: GNAT family N-acetyltransferase [Desulfobacterales bacterium]|jgi:acyl-CoA hydrolase/GNAT superfamily N-acetyltransferase|nr:GNAT family N-acetyltransferase [Desulfobacteraceae bacterium]MDD3991245.1 GNAT family N-acetyltransferase [Desulfobacteraceae bacterium]MDY0312070.1 GNAT family N-acetyltransferase [Desulfobacterales bacterium]
MARTGYWADHYAENRCTPQEGVALLRPGQRIFIGASCGEPQALVRALAESAERFTDLEIVRLLALESTPLTRLAGEIKTQSFNIRNFYLGSAKPRRLAPHLRFITPMNLSSIPLLFKSRRMPLHAALIQVSPPDDFGWMSLGVSVDITLAAAQTADLVIAQVNPRMPRTLGRTFIHVNDVHRFVEYEEPLLTVESPPEMEAANIIGRLIARLIDDGSTIQVSPGATTKALLLALENKNDLGVHSEYITNGMMHLFSKGVITNRLKGNKEGRLVATAAIGTADLYEFLDDNPAVDFQPSDYVCDPGIIASHFRMVSMNVAMAMDLTGQAAADAQHNNMFTGVTGMLDFVRGAARAEGGKSILMLPSTAAGGQRSRIVPLLEDTAVVVPRGDVHYVVTEYGVVNLFGKNLQERAMAMISIAHPDFRSELFHRAQKMGLLGAERTLSESFQGVYPVRLEKQIDIDGQIVTIRPAKPVDERRIQEHFYNLHKEDVVARFFHEKTTFVRDEVEEVSQIDYIKDLTLLALVGEIGFGRVVAVAEYLLLPAKNVAEVAFSVDHRWQGKGLGKLMMCNLADAARENGIAGLVAYTNPNNQGMIRLFRSLPYKVHTTFEADMVHLSCRFDEPI